MNNAKNHVLQKRSCEDLVPMNHGNRHKETEIEYS